MVERNFSRELTAIWEPRDAAMQEALNALEDTYAQANRTIAAQAEVIAKMREALGALIDECERDYHPLERIADQARAALALAEGR